MFRGRRCARRRLRCWRRRSCAMPRGGSRCMRDPKPLRRPQRSYSFVISDRNQQTVARRRLVLQIVSRRDLAGRQLKSRATEARLSPGSTRCMRHDARRSAGIRSSAAVTCCARAFRHPDLEIPRRDAAQQRGIQLHKLRHRSIRQIADQGEIGGGSGDDRVVFDGRVGVIWSSPYSGAFFAMMVIARMIGT